MKEERWLEGSEGGRWGSWGSWGAGLLTGWIVGEYGASLMGLSVLVKSVAGA